MPGTPPTTPRHAIPRIASTDTDDVPRDLNAAVDRIDVTAPIFGSGLLSARPSTGAGIADRYYYATDAVRPDGSTGVLYRDAGGASPTWSAVTPLAPRAISTALPGSPVTGQEILYQDATILAAANIVWPLRYDGTKWAPIGCSPLFAEVTTSETTTSLTYANLTTTGPSITVPLAGDYDVAVGSFMTINTAAAQALMSYAIGATAASDADALGLQSPTGAANASASVMRPRRKTALAASAALVAKYRVNLASTGTFASRWIQVTPVRLG